MNCCLWRSTTIGFCQRVYVKQAKRHFRMRIIQTLPSDDVLKHSAEATAEGGVRSSTVSTSMWSQSSSSSTCLLTSSRLSADEFTRSTSSELARWSPTAPDRHDAVTPRAGGVATQPSRRLLALATPSNAAPLPPLCWNPTNPSNGVTRKCVIGVSGRGRTGYSGGGNDVTYGEGQRWKGYGGGARNGGCSISRGSLPTWCSTQELERWPGDVDPCDVIERALPTASSLYVRVVTSSWPSLTPVELSSSSTFVCFVVWPSSPASSSGVCMAVKWWCVVPPSCDEKPRCMTQ